ncbi:hypothetical protein J4Q44_G00252670 [Coregonus suidteri]|uniref:Uncharacterized protein n=1 Tax=Coregonus suidteri TaxID=861788 RepID=A0AAN8LNG4_9TELE
MTYSGGHSLSLDTDNADHRRGEEGILELQSVSSCPLPANSYGWVVPSALSQTQTRTENHGGGEVEGKREQEKERWRESSREGEGKTCPCASIPSQSRCCHYQSLFEPKGCKLMTPLQGTCKFQPRLQLQDVCFRDPDLVHVRHLYVT